MAIKPQSTNYEYLEDYLNQSADLVQKLRSPLSTTRNALHLLQEAMHRNKPVDQKQLSKYLRVISSNLKRQLNLVENIIMNDEIVRGQVRMLPSDFDLNDVGMELFEEYVDETNQQNIVLDTRFAQDKTPVHADIKKVLRIIHNLIQISLDQIPESIMIQTGRGQGEYYIGVLLEDGTFPKDIELSGFKEVAKLMKGRIEANTSNIRLWLPKSE